MWALVVLFAHLSLWKCCLQVNVNIWMNGVCYVLLGTGSFFNAVTFEVFHLYHWAEPLLTGGLAVETGTFFSELLRQMFSLFRLLSA